MVKVTNRRAQKSEKKKEKNTKNKIKVPMCHKMAAANNVFPLLCLLLVSFVVVNASRLVVDDEHFNNIYTGHEKNIPAGEDQHSKGKVTFDWTHSNEDFIRDMTKHFHDKVGHHHHQEEDEIVKDQNEDEIHQGEDVIPPEGGSWVQSPIAEAQSLGSWELHNANTGVSAMQLQLMPNNKAVWYDTTTLGPSFRKMDPPGFCPASFEMGGVDCFAHALSYDIETGDVRTLKIDGDPWCSSGGLDINGDLVGTGGNKKGLKTIRTLQNCANCEFKEKHNALLGERWYATQQILGDGSIIVVGGRNAFSYDLIPGPQLNMKPKAFNLPFLKQTTAPSLPGTKGPAVENNLYPFVFLINDQSVFIFANDRAILINPYTGKVVRQYPVLPGGSRNYPPSGMSAILPYKLDQSNPLQIDPEVVVCGGNSPDAFGVVDAKHTNEKVYMPALQDCWRIKPLDKKAKWVREQDMPSRRTMGDLIHLPTGDLLFINGAKKGTSGWEDAIEPNFTPVLYSPDKPFGQRFKELTPTNIPRMYHSSSALLPDGKILVTGSNAHERYTANGAFPTDTRVEKFTPPYLDESLDGFRQTIMEDFCKKEMKYGEEFEIPFEIPQWSGSENMMVTMIAPPFTTHGFSMNQRMLILPLTSATTNTVTVVAPAVGGIAPPGYYMLFLVNRGVPSRGMWVKLH